MFKQFYQLAGPAIITNILNMGTLLINAAFAGQLADPTSLGAIGLTNTMLLCMVSSLMIGLNSAQETLTS